jgi:hypothetical protein
MALEGKYKISSGPVTILATSENIKSENEKTENSKLLLGVAFAINYRIAEKFTIGADIEYHGGKSTAILDTSLVFKFKL